MKRARAWGEYGCVLKKRKLLCDSPGVEATFAFYVLVVVGSYQLVCQHVCVCASVSARESVRAYVCVRARLWRFV